MPNEGHLGLLSPLYTQSVFYYILSLHFQQSNLFIARIYNATEVPVWIGMVFMPRIAFVPVGFFSKSILMGKLGNLLKKLDVNPSTEDSFKVRTTTGAFSKDTMSS